MICCLGLNKVNMNNWNVTIGRLGLQHQQFIPDFYMFLKNVWNYSTSYQFNTTLVKGPSGNSQPFTLEYKAQLKSDCQLSGSVRDQLFNTEPSEFQFVDKSILRTKYGSTQFDNCSLCCEENYCFEYFAYKRKRSARARENMCN